MSVTSLYDNFISMFVIYDKPASALCSKFSTLTSTLKYAWSVFRDCSNGIPCLEIEYSVEDNFVQNPIRHMLIMQPSLLASPPCWTWHKVSAWHTGPAYEWSSATSCSLRTPHIPGLSSPLGFASSNLLIWSTSCRLQRQSSHGILSKTSRTLSLSNCSPFFHLVQVKRKFWWSRTLCLFPLFEKPVASWTGLALLRASVTSMIMGWWLYCELMVSLKPRILCQGGWEEWIQCSSHGLWLSLLTQLPSSTAIYACC